jgi:hypothetical protein
MDSSLANWFWVSNREYPESSKVLFDVACTASCLSVLQARAEDGVGDDYMRVLLEANP